MARKTIPHTLKRAIGNAITALMTREKITQLQLAEVLDISDSAISKFRNAANAPSLETLIAVGDYFKVRMDFLLGRTPSEAPLENPITVDNLKENISKRLVSLMEREEVTQYRLAKDLKITEESIRRIRMSIYAPDFTTLLALADYFKVSTDYILGRTDDPSMPQ